MKRDVNRMKIEVLKERLAAIAGHVEISTQGHYVRSVHHPDYDDSFSAQIRDCIQGSDVVFIGIDNGEERIACEKVCEQMDPVRFLSCGVSIEKEKHFYKCSWNPETPQQMEREIVYGRGNGSYISIVTEATSVAFSMLLYNLKYPDAYKFRHREKQCLF